ncbi:hypothetical protein CTM97_18525 [Photobacterium phosphoreum]|uniref:Uncharacterized protein n=1 Tax=Photobacterium phosphoreum TaxID=659 RepID=A0A2T3JBP2_PHOPO|nr:hypothetical protein [Photobacterium phosphoreum]PSU19934.1 hypothetical protein CTM96_20505 [Photobacterium phosphoreum]PSU38783.1 hypothetical protein CTM97_18525 [Photobacterium phosphoreum]PSU46294.1 hypothetical protein C9J18_20725 [Photobacterium phosphoreum]
MATDNHQYFDDPKKVVWFIVISFFALSLVSSLVGLYSPMFELNENQILYIYSTSAQVLAGIYGLTLSGFIFFRNELSREQFEDNLFSNLDSSNKKRMPASRALDFLFRAVVIDADLYERAKNVTSLRNSFVHGAEPEVSEEMVIISKSVLKLVTDALEKHENK